MAKRLCDHPKPYYQSKDGMIRLYHGDSADIAPYLEAPDLVFTSPPYLEQRTYGGKTGTWLGMMRRVFKGINEHDATQILVNLGLVYKDGECVQYWDPWVTWMRHTHRFFGWYVWDKTHALPGDWAGRFAPAHEFIFHFNTHSRKPNHVLDANPTGKYWKAPGIRCKDDVVRKRPKAVTGHALSKISDSVIRMSMVKGHLRDGRGKNHPAPFPVAFAQHFILSYTDPGEVVLDPFVGSGTTLLAARDSGRVGIGIELNEEYCELAVRRLEKEPRLSFFKPKKRVERRKLFDA